MKTVTVRIAVAINRDGTYRAFGSSDAKDGAMKFAVRPFKKRTGQTIIIEHEVPLPTPEPVEVQGEVG